MQKNRIHEVIPNDYPEGIMPNDKLTPLFRMAIRHEIEEAKAKGLPIARLNTPGANRQFNRASPTPLPLKSDTLSAGPTPSV